MWPKPHDDYDGETIRSYDCAAEEIFTSGTSNLNSVKQQELFWYSLEQTVDSFFFFLSQSQEQKAPLITQKKETKVFTEVQQRSDFFQLEENQVKEE